MSGRSRMAGTLLPLHRSILAVLPSDDAWSVAQVVIALAIPIKTLRVERAIKFLVKQRLVRHEQSPGNPDRFSILPRGVATRDQPAALIDDGGLMSDANVSRGAETFRTAMDSHGLEDLTDLAALPPSQRQAFERTWTRLMYAACAMDGHPIPTHREGGNGMWDKTRRATHADSIRRALSSRRP